jgi:hypothetical protein
MAFTGYLGVVLKLFSKPRDKASLLGYVLIRRAVMRMFLGHQQIAKDLALVISESQRGAF